MDELSFASDALAEFAVKVLSADGVALEDARLVADSLVTADLWGHRSHGIFRLTWYAARIRSGVVDPRAYSRRLIDIGAVVLLDACDGIGQVAAAGACDLAAERAKTFGAAVVGVRNSNHFGTAAYFTRRMAERGLVGILITNSSPAMAPWGGREKVLGANPWSIAVPAGRYGVSVVDISNTGVARGKIYAAVNAGESIPATWATDSDGTPTTDPAKAILGLIQPMGQHKGYAIGFMMDALAGALTGSGTATDVVGPYVPDRPSRCGHLVIAIDIAALDPDGDFPARMERLIELNTGSARARGVERIYFPGELEAAALKRNPSRVITMPEDTVRELEAVGAERGVVFPSPLQRPRA